MRKTILLLFLGIISPLFTFYCFSQKQHPLIPLSPTAAALGKYGDTDVSLFTGQLNPTVKLLKIQFNDFTFPVDLNYASSGLKVHEIPASVGMGWSISGTSAITRQVRSVPDEQNHGYNGLNPTATIIQALNAGSYSPTPAYQTISETNFKRGIGETDYDGEPDLFNFSFQEKGGKFFFDEIQNGSSTKLATIIPRQPLRIIAHFNYSATGQLFNGQNQQGRIEDFEITDEKGIKYTFAKQEGALLDDDAFQFGKNIVSTWYLTKIETPNGNTLDFNYIQRTIDLPHAQSEYRYLYEAILPNLDFTTHSTVSESTTTETVLQEILINNGTWGKISFIEDTNNRTDWAFSTSGSKPKSLKEVHLADGQNNLVRKFMFNYVEDANRLLLRSVQEFGPSDTQNEPHVFDYYNESNIPHLPSGGSNVITREDHWGYYNANTLGALLPDFQVVTINSAGILKTLSNFQYDSYLDSLKKTAAFLIEKFDKNTPKSVQSFSTYYVTATNRKPDFSSAIIGQLKKITYPTKAFSEFVYEANSYYGKTSKEFNPCSGEYESIGTITDNSAANCDNNSSTFTIAEGAFSCIKVLLNAQINSPNQGIIEANLAIVGDGNGFLYEKNFVCNNGQTKNENDFEYKVLPPGTYTITANLCGENASGSNTSTVTIDVQAIPTVVGSAFSTRISGGVRIKEIKDCPDADPNHCLIKEYTYTSENDPTNSSGRIVTNGTYKYPVKYFTTDNGGNNINAQFLNSASQLPLATTLGQYIGYKTVIVKEAKTVENVRIYKGKTVYNYRSPDTNDAPDINAGSFPFWSISSDWKRGVLTQTKVYDQAGIWLKDDQNSYVLKPSLDYAKFTAIKTGKYIHNIEASPNGYDPNVFTFSKYQSISGFQFNEQSTNKEQFKAGSNLTNIQNITQFAYQNDNHLQLTQTSTTNSKGENLVTQFKFPNDITLGVLLPSANLLSSRKAELLQTETFLNSASISKSQSFFSNFQGKTLPSSQKLFIGGSSVPATETFQLSYDSYGNSTSFKEVGGATNSLIWGYDGQYPVVYIANGTVKNASELLSILDSTSIEIKANFWRDSLTNAHISSFSFKQMVGMLSNKAPNKLKKSFVFDGLNRLEHIIDHQKNILKAYQYQYASTLGGENYVKEMMPRIGSNSLPIGYQNLQVLNNYFDGLGRNLQTVSQEAGPNGANDIVLNATTYDGYGRPEKSYIPYSNVGNGSLATLPTSVHGDVRPFTENYEFDNSPLNRLYKVRGVGNAWFTADKFSENTTEISGKIRSYSVASNGAVSSSIYPANSLYKKNSTDEQGNSTFEYFDKQGRLVQVEKPLNATDTSKTAYVYDNVGQLRYIVQPQSYNSATSFDENSSVFSQGIFAYKYDERGRKFASHVPSGGWTYAVFDKLNREVLSQTELQKTSNKWSFMKFDAFQRTLQKGDLTNTSSRSDLQIDFDDITNAYEIGNSNQSFPSSVSSSPTQLREVFLYDNYDFIASEWAFNRANTYHDNYANAKGLLTGVVSWNSADFSKVYHTVLHYDTKNRTIQSYQTHQLGGIEPWKKAIISNFQYNFSNQITIQKIIHQKDNVPNTEDKTENEYDHVGNLTKVFHGINGNRLEVARFTYNAEGQLINKKIRADGNFFTGGTKNYITRPTADGIVTQNNTQDIARKAIVLLPTTDITAINLTSYLAQIDPNAPQGTTINGLQSIDFKHHIRGGLLGINLDGFNNPIPNVTEGDLFSYKLDYETTGLYDGNIGKQTWQNVNSSNNAPLGVRSYTFGYDASSRLKYANYAGINGEDFSMPNLDYDKNGNITNLKRKGKNGGSYGDIDNLSYDYTGNKLNFVNDAINGNEDVGDFKNNNTGNNDYEYWSDGSLKVDRNKGISQIDYDSYLKKVKQINFSNGNWVKFVYNGSGTLLTRSNSLGDVWDYVANIIYKNGVPYQMSAPEGRAVYVAGQWIYEFEYRDHQNNLRVAFKADGNQLVQTQTNETDPFGLTIQPLSIVGVSPQNYRFQNQEKVEDFGLNLNWFKYRPEDPTYGRMWQVDELAEKYVHNSVYAFSENKVTNHIELDGLEAEAVMGLAFVQSKMTPEQRLEANKNSAIAQASVISLFLPGPEDFVIGAFLATKAGQAVTRFASAISKVFSKADDVMEGAAKVETTVVKLTKSQSDAISGLEKQVIKHEQKLKDYIKNPLAGDNKGMLKNASKELKEKIIDSRIKSLNNQINTFKKDIEAIKDGTKKVLEKQ